MSPAPLRISRKEFALLLTLPHQTAYNALGTIKYFKKHRKIAIVTSSKHEKRAVYRNRLRRRLYELFRKSTYDGTIIFYASKNAYSMEYDHSAKLFQKLTESFRENT